MRRSQPDVALDARQEAMAAAGIKGLVPVGRPFLDYAMSALADAGFTSICLVIGPEHDAVRARYGHDVPLERVRVTFATQAKPLGTADAVLAAEGFAGADRFLVVNSDNYYPVDVLRAVGCLPGAALPAFEALALVEEGNLRPERVASFPTVHWNERGDLTSLDDGQGIWPPAPETHVSMNCWWFTPAIFTACRAIRPGASGELELPDAVRHAVGKMREGFHVLPVRARVLDLTGRDDVATVTAALRDVEVRL